MESLRIWSGNFPSGEKTGKGANEEDAESTV